MPITWAVFQSEPGRGQPPGELAPGWSLTRYRVGRVVQVRGGASSEPSGDGPVPQPGSTLRRWEGPAWPTSPASEMTSEGLAGGSEASRSLFAVQATIQ